MAGKTVTFESKFSQHVITRHPQIDTPLATGGWITSQKPVRYNFEPALDHRGQIVGRLKVHVGEDKLLDGSGWLRRGEEQGIERDAPTALQAHREFGRDFWLQGFEPGVLLPRPQDFRKELRTALVALDEEKLVEMLKAERGSHQRAELLSECEDALAQVREVRAAAEAEALKSAPKAKPKPARED